MTETKRGGISGAAFAASFFGFIVLLAFGADKDATWAIWLAFVFAVFTIIFLLLFLNEQPNDAPAPPTVEERILAPTPVAAAPKAEAAPGYYDYKGQIHDVIDVEGIGPVYAERLKTAGIHTTARLCYLGTDAIAEVAKVPKKTAEKWIAMAQLIKVNGIGKQYAEALVRGGVMSVEELKKGNPDLLSGQVTSYLQTLDASVLGQTVSPKRVMSWQKKAAGMRRVRLAVPES